MKQTLEQRFVVAPVEGEASPRSGRSIFAAVVTPCEQYAFEQMRQRQRSSA